MSKGFVYVLYNDSMPLMVKIGRTTRSSHQRCNELWQTGVPTPFLIAMEVFSPDCCELEAIMHKEFSEVRVTPAREFFRASMGEVCERLEELHRDQVERLVSEYLPRHTIVPTDLKVDESHLEDLASAIGDHPENVASAMGTMDVHEVYPALCRWRDMAGADALDEDAS